MSAAALERALGEAGLPCAVEARDRLAVIVLDAGSTPAFTDAAQRQLAVRLAAAHGFTHLALELPGPADAPHASVAPPARAPLPRA